MRNTTLITTAVLALAFAASAGAQYRGDRDERDGRYPTPDRMGRVAVLAHEMEETSSWVHQRFERNNRRPNRAEARVAASLHELEQAAEHFHRQVESYRRDPQHTRRDFRALLEAYDAAVRSLYNVEPRGYVDRGMDQMGTLLAELSRYYGRTWRRERYDRHDRHDRDGRYDRYDRDDDDDDEHRPPRR